MPLPLSLTQPFRQGQLTVGSGWRAFFAPFNQALAVSQTSTSIGPTIYDLQVLGKFTGSAGSIPTGWFDLGYIDKVKLSPSSKIGNVMSGYRNAVRAKYRADVAEKVSFVFKEMGRMQLKVASGEGVFNLLVANGPASTSGPLSATGVPAVPIGASGYVASGSVANYVGQPTLYTAAGSGALFPAGTYIVCDQDYNNTSYGYIGDAGANVFQGAVNDVDFIRQTSDYVATVKAVVGDALILTKPFVGGGNNPLGAANTAPTTGAKIQAIKGFTSRGGGTTLLEWSAVLVLDTIDASQLLLYYPRLAPDAFTGIEANNLTGATSMQVNDLAASFESMAFDDPLDGETVVRYSAYFPHANPSIDIQG